MLDSLARAIGYVMLALWVAFAVGVMVSALLEQRKQRRAKLLNQRLLHAAEVWRDEEGDAMPRRFERIKQGSHPTNISYATLDEIMGAKREAA